MKLLIIFIYLVTINFSYAFEKPDLKNLVLIKNPKIYEDVVFMDINQKNVNLDDFKGKLIILNFWATWCAPCKKEMPSLDSLYQNDNFKNLQIFAINVDKPNHIKSKKFFTDLKIKKLEIFFDKNLNLVNEFKLRGVPTSILINKKGKEFARIIGSIDFEDKKFIKWLSSYD